MKVLQVITLTELGGAQSVVANLSNELTQRGHEVIVAGGEGDGKMFQLLSPNIKQERLPALVRRISPLNELKAIWQMRRLYRKYRPDVVQLHSSKAGLLGRIAFPGKRIVYTVHGFDSIRLAYRKFLPLEKMLQGRAASIVGVSKYDEVNMLSEGLRKNIGYIYNGIPAPKETLKTDPFADLKKTHKGVILCIARLSPPKKHDLFLEVAQKMPQTAFVWIGNQNEPDFDVPENVRFMGNILNAGEYCRYADAFFLPSNYEGLPIVILEALACACPVVASKVGGIPEILDGKNGFAVENNADDCVNGLSEILSHREIFAKNALATYGEKFTVDKMATSYEEIYNKIKK